jgi:hypothetical protein
MKKRIKEVVDSRGDSKFTVQEKWLFWWINDVTFFKFEDAHKYVTYKPKMSVIIHDIDED